MKVYYENQTEWGKDMLKNSTINDFEEALTIPKEL